MVSIGLVYSIHDSTEVAIQKMIDTSHRMIDVQSKVGGEAKEGWGINPVMKRHLELEIKTLQNAPRDAEMKSWTHSLRTKKGEGEEKGN
jgi:hypothetical protein